MTELFKELAEKHSLVTIETWNRFLYEESGAHGNSYLCYLDATDQIVSVLTEIVDTQKDFESLKKELLHFLEERKEFLDHGDNNHPPFF